MEGMAPDVFWTRMPEALAVCNGDVPTVSWNVPVGSGHDILCVCTRRLRQSKDVMGIRGKHGVRQSRRMFRSRVGSSYAHLVWCSWELQVPPIEQPLPLVE